MTQARLRMTIFFLWTGALFASLVLALSAPSVVRDGTFDDAQMTGLMPAIVALFMPALGALAGFWFPSEERRRAKSLPLSRERCLVSIALTCLYLSIAIALIAWPLFVVEYPRTLELATGGSLEERINQATHVAATLSPLALAPIHYLTSRS